MRASDITKIEINSCVFWIEPKIVFIKGYHYFFRELADGGLLIYDLNHDGDISHAKIISHSDPIMKSLRDQLFEKQVGLTDE